MQKFTKTNGEKFIRSTDDAQVAQFGHLNKLIDALNARNFIELSLIEAQGNITSNNIEPGINYYITNAPNTDLGVITIGISTNSYDIMGVAGFYVPAYRTANPNWSTVQSDSGIAFTDYTGSWDMSVSNYTTGQVVTFGGENWISVDNSTVTPVLTYSASLSTYRPGAVGNTKWVKLPKKLTNGYFIEWDVVYYVIPSSGNPTLRMRQDKRGNIVYQNNASNSISLFKWGDDGCNRNVVEHDSLLDCVNAYALPPNASGIKVGNLVMNRLLNNASIIRIDHDTNIFRCTLDNFCAIADTRFFTLQRADIFNAAIFQYLQGVGAGTSSNAPEKLIFQSGINVDRSTITYISKYIPFNYVFGQQKHIGSAITNWLWDHNQSISGTNNQVQFFEYYSRALNFEFNYNLSQFFGFYTPPGLISSLSSSSFSYSTLHGFLNMAGSVAISTTGTVFTAAVTSLTVSGTPWSTDQWKNYQVIITGGTGAGQMRLILSNTSNILNLATSWQTVPDSTSTYVVQNSPATFATASPFVDISATNNTLTDTSRGTANLSSWVTNEFTNYQIVITEGTGAGQIRTISSNTANSVTISSTWTVNPDATSKYIIQGPAYSGTTLKLPYGWKQLGEIWLYNTGGQNINLVTNMEMYTNRAGVKFRVYNGTGVTFKYISRNSYSSATSTPDGILGVSDVVLHGQNINGSPIQLLSEYCHLEGIGGKYLYIKDSASFT